MCGGCVTFAFNKEIAQYALRICCSYGRESEAMIKKWHSNSRNMSIKCLTCLKLRLGWGKYQILAQGLNKPSLLSYQIVLLFAPSNLGYTLPFWLLCS